MSKRLPVLPFWTFGLAGAYAYISAVILGLAMNLFVSVLLSPELSGRAKIPLYVAAALFLVSSTGFFAINWALESARNQWLAEGALPNRQFLLEPIEMRLLSLYGGLAMGVLGGALGIYFLASRSLPLLKLQ